MRFPKKCMMLLIAACACGFNTTLSHASPAFTDANWVSLTGYPGTSGQVNAVVANTNSGLVYAAGKFTAAGNILAMNIAVWNGTNWSALGNGLGNAFNGTVNALALDAVGNLYAGGTFTNAGGIAATNIAVWDGTNWSSLGLGMNGAVKSLAADDSGVIYAGGNFTKAGGTPANYIAQWNGSAWSPLGSGLSNMGSSTSVSALTLDDSGNLYAGGFFSAAGGIPATNIAVWNGSTWSAVGTMALSREVTALQMDASGNLYAGGFFSVSGGVFSGIGVWNGSTWSAIDSGSFDGSRIFALAFDSSGALYAGGNFLDIGGVMATNLAKWDGSTWSRVGSSQLGQSATVVQTLAIDARGNLFAGGTFNTNYFSSQNYIAQWNGTNWSTVGWKVGGPGLGDAKSGAFALALDNGGNLYAAGTFALSKWNGTNWAIVGSAVYPGHFNAMLFDPAGNLYTGGSFTAVGGTNMTNIAKWDGTNWSSVIGANGPGFTGVNYVAALALDNSGNLFAGGTTLKKWDGTNWTDLGLNGTTYALAFDASGNLYAGGKYNSIGGGSGGSIARWDGTNWSAFGPTLNGFVYALAFDKLGNLYVGGAFTSVGTMEVPGVAKWNGSRWISFGPTSAPAPQVFALALDAFGNLYAGGNFDSLAGVSAKNIICWNGSQWSPLGSGVSGMSGTYGPVEAFVLGRSNQLYIGGNFTTAGTNFSGNLVQANLNPGLSLITTKVQSNGALTFLLQGTPGTPCIFQTSTDLIYWTSLGTILCASNGFWSFTNSPTTASQRYFRAALPQ